MSTMPDLITGLPPGVFEEVVDFGDALDGDALLVEAGRSVTVASRRVCMCTLGTTEDVPVSTNTK